MKFVKGMVLGGMITAGIAWACAEGLGQNKRKMMRKGRQFARNFSKI